MYLYTLFYITHLFKVYVSVLHRAAVSNLFGMRDPTDVEWNSGSGANVSDVAAAAAKSLQSCLTLCDPMDSSPPGFSIHRILQARILQWVAYPFSRGSSGPRNWTRVSCIVEKAIAPHSSALAWKIPWVEEPGRLQVHGIVKSQTQLSDFTFTFHFDAIEKEMATHSSVLLGESQGRGSLVGCRLWGCTESDTTEAT